MFKNPVFRFKATQEHPLYVCTGDVVGVDGPYPMEATSSGTVWYDVTGWRGTAILKPASREALDYIPAHLRVINRIICWFKK